MALLGGEPNEGSAISYGFYVKGTPVTSDEIMRLPIVTATSFVANLVGSDIDARTPPSGSDSVITFYKNAVSFGTGSVTTAGAVSFSTTAISFAAEDIWTAVLTSDGGSMTDFGVHLLGARV